MILDFISNPEQRCQKFAESSPENFHAGFSVGVIRRLETKFCHA